MVSFTFWSCHEAFGSQERISQVLEGLNCQYVFLYVDGIIIITKGDYEDNVQVLHQVLQRWKIFQLRLTKHKGHIGMKELKYFGNLVSTGGFAPQH
jgi:hypothetical protein